MSTCQFGSIIHVFNKNEFMVSSNNKLLSNIESWKYNRPPDIGRINDIKNNILKIGYVEGIIYIAFILDENKYVCYDGNHRRIAMNEISTTLPCIIHLYMDVTHNMIKERFISINSAISVPEIYITNDEKIYLLISKTRDWILFNYPSLVRSSKTPIKPHYSIQTIESILSNYFMINIDNIDINTLTYINIINKINSINNPILINTKKFNETQISKAKNNNAYFLLINFTDYFDFHLK